MSQLNVDNINNRTGTNGGPNFPSGITIAVGQTAYIHGNLQVDGTETIVNTETLNVADKTVGIGSTTNASNTTADGAGIEVFASSSQTGNNKTITWSNTSNSWEFGPNDVGLKVGTGITVYGGSGIVSATSFKGDGSELTGIDATALKDGSGSVKIQANSDGAVVTGILTATSFVGDGANLTNLPPGGNTFTGIASGTIANNKPVGVTLDGKVMQVTGNFVPKASPTTSANWAGSYTDNYNMGALWNSTNEHMILATTNQAQQLEIQVYVTSTTTGSVQPPNYAAITTIPSTSDNRGYSAYCYDSGNNRVVAFNTQTNPGPCRWNVLTPSTTQAYTNNNGFVALNNMTSVACCYEPTRGKVVLLKRTAYNLYLYGVVCEVSGTSLDELTMGSDNQPDTNVAVKDGSFDIIPIGGGKVLAAYNDNNNNYFKVVVGTLDSGGANTITWGTPVTQPNTQQQVWVKLGYDEGTGQAVIFYQNITTGGPLSARAITISGTTPTISSTEVLVNNVGSSTHFGTTYHKKSGALWVFYFSGGNQGTLRGREVIYPSGGSLSFGTQFDLGGNDENGFITGVAAWNHPSDATKNYDFITNYADRIGTSNNVQYTTNVIETTSSLNNQQSYVGYADQAYTDGQTATIKSYGNNVSTLTGLTPGTVYYVTATGDLATSAPTFSTGTFLSGTPVAGTALNATTLLIRDPTTRTT